MKRIRPWVQFEERVQRLVEGSFRHLFGGQLVPVELARRLAHAVEDEASDGFAPDRYDLYLQPDDYEAVILADGSTEPQLVEYVVELARQLGLSLRQTPRVRLLADDTVPRRQIEVVAAHGDYQTDVTRTVRRISGSVPPGLRALDAFLILDGRRHVPLDRPVISIGRRNDNDVVLPSGTVSRRHAQIRWRYGRFVIYDLGSRGGTRVNDQPVAECALHPGDVIRLGEATLIYGEGGPQNTAAAERHEAGQTLILPRPDDAS